MINDVGAEGYLYTLDLCVVICYTINNLKSPQYQRVIGLGKLQKTMHTMKFVQILVLVLTVLLAGPIACVNVRYVDGPQPQGGGYGQQLPPGKFVKSKYLVGQETHSYQPQIQVRAKGLDQITLEKLRDELCSWAIEKVKGGGQPPTDEELTVEAQHRAGTQDVQARAGNNFNSTKTAIPRKLVLRKVVDPSTLTEAQKEEAQRRFYENLQRRTQ